MRLPALFGTSGAWRERQLAHALRAVPLFQHVPPDDLVALWRRFSEEAAPAGTVLCRRGERGDRFYVIRRGTACVSLGTGPHSSFVRTLGPGDCFGEMALFTGQPRSADVVVTEDAALWVLERRDFDEVMGASIPLLRAVIHVLCNRLEHTTNQLESRSAPDPDADAGMRFGPYRVLEQLGAGGHAAVYSAVHVSTETAAAVKVLPAAWGNSPVLQRRLRQEAAALQRVRHQNVIRVLEVGEVDARLGGGCYLAMEWLPSALDRALRAQYPEPFAPATALRIARGVCEGLGAVHAVGLVHRDVKPSNVLLRADGSPVLTDFGLAASLRETAHLHRLTPTDSFVGSADYIAPEQVIEDTVDARADLYSLGVVLYELLTGAVPFAGRTPREALRAHTDEPPPPLPQAIPPLTRAVVERLLRKSPEERFQSTTEVAEALGHAFDEARRVDPGAEQRAYLRAVASHTQGQEAGVAPAFTLAWQDEDRWVPFEFALLDVSQGGLGVLSPDPPFVGARVRAIWSQHRLGPQGAGEAPAREISGHVVYESAIEVGLGVPTYRCGIAFDGPQPWLPEALPEIASGAPLSRLAGTARA